MRPLKIKKPKTLYIIGNGFDLYHGLDTRYQKFAFYLQDNYRKIYELFITYYRLPELDRKDPNSKYDPLWAEFEKALADLDFETMLVDNSDYLANPSSEDFRDSDWHTYQVEMKMNVDELTTEMRKAFKEFILSVEFPDSVDDKFLALERDAVYISFNYTNTLERYYRIRSEQILYIHGKAINPHEELVLGHGVPPETFKEKQKREMPDGLNEQQMEEWRDEMARNYDYSFEAGKAELMDYFHKSYKSTAEIIQQNKSFFDALDAVEKVIVLGHSLAEVDQPYLTKVVSSIDPRCCVCRFLVPKKVDWVVSYYSAKERDSHLRKLKRMCIRKKHIQLVKMEELKPKQPTLF